VLPGLFRQRVLAEGQAREGALHRKDLPAIAAAVWANSVQGARPVARLGNQPLALAQAAHLCHSLSCQTLFA
jgi:branched-subunit amino acid aminotransferase/4-amino-4-deoxychorismate lyase